MKAIRQGDVMLVPCKIPSGARRIPVRPIALGERTGHHHSLMTASGAGLEDAVEMYEVDTPEGVKTYMRITEDGVSLVHQQHKAQPVEPIEYVYIPQVENSDWGTQRVVD
jgi:hypothetical protein